MAKKRKKVAKKTRNKDTVRVAGEPDQLAVDLEVAHPNWHPPQLSVRTYKGVVVLSLYPDASLWLDVKGAKKLAAALLRVAQRRADIDAYRRHRGI